MLGTGCAANRPTAIGRAPKRVADCAPQREADCAPNPPPVLVLVLVGAVTIWKPETVPKGDVFGVVCWSWQKAV